MTRRSTRWKGLVLVTRTRGVETLATVSLAVLAALLDAKREHHNQQPAAERPKETT